MAHPVSLDAPWDSSISGRGDLKNEENMVKSGKKLCCFTSFSSTLPQRKRNLKKKKNIEVNFIK